VAESVLLLPLLLFWLFLLLVVAACENSGFTTAIIIAGTSGLALLLVLYLDYRWRARKQYKRETFEVMII